MKNLALLLLTALATVAQTLESPFPANRGMLFAWPLPDPVEEVSYFTVLVTALPPAPFTELLRTTTFPAYNVGELMLPLDNGVYRVDVSATNVHGFEAHLTTVHVFWFFRPEPLEVTVTFPEARR